MGIMIKLLTILASSALGMVSAFVAPSTFIGSEITTSGGCRAASLLWPGNLSMAVRDVGSSEELDNIVKDAKEGLVVVDYSTTWCGPCKAILPKFESLSEEFKDAVFVKVIGDSTNDASKLMKREGVRSVPSFHFWKDGKKVDSVNGANEPALEETLRSLA